MKELLASNPALEILALGLKTLDSGLSVTTHSADDRRRLSFLWDALGLKVNSRPDQDQKFRGFERAAGEQKTIKKRRRLLVSLLCDPYHKIDESPEALWIMERKTNKSGEDKKCLRQ